MLKLTVDKIVDKINKEEAFNAICIDSSFSISIEAYVPYVCTAIHNGGNLRQELRSKIALNKMERWIEEDPLTGNLISSLPIRIISYDSRYEYDLNRPPEEAVYEEAWGQKIWKIPLSEEETNKSLLKHTNFYRVIDALIAKLESKFDACVVYDIHSYNYKKEGRNPDAPIINLGTENIDCKKYDKFIKKWISELKKIQINSMNVSVLENEVFFGRGYLLKHITQKFHHTLVLATEFKKVYIDENNGDEYPEIINSIERGLKEAIINHVTYFAKVKTSMVFDKKYQLLSSAVDDALKMVDEDLFIMLKKVELLDYLNPINVESEKRRFIKSKYKVYPIFRYKPLPFDVNSVRRNLYKLPIEKIKDVTLKSLYEEIIDEFANKIELLILRGQREFLYSSLKNYGEPDKADLNNAKFILHCNSENQDHELISSNEVAEIIREDIKEYGFKCHVELVKNLVSGAMVVNSTKTLKLRKDATFPKSLAKGLSHHEIGVHMLTTVNAGYQPLKFLRLGMPNNTVTQEGLAILSEYLSANFDLGRLKTLALRVLAINSMLKQYDFIETFTMLKDDYGMEDENAFYLTTRVYRGGGFTKDYLYLKGFKLMHDYHFARYDLTKLFLGKCSHTYARLLDELISREILFPPKFVPKVFETSIPKDPTLEFIINSLK